jgi:hypothetical protein
VLPVITFNKKAAFYLPSDDRRHYVLWSELAENDMTPEEANAFWKWYEAGGYTHVAAYLDSLDLSDFNPKAPPTKTPAFWEIVDISRAPEDAELADTLDLMGNPIVTTIDEVYQNTQDQDFRRWLADKANHRVIGHRFEDCGYNRVRNADAKDGLFKVNGKRQAVYGKSDIDNRTRIEHARALAKKRHPIRSVKSVKSVIPYPPSFCLSSLPINYSSTTAKTRARGEGEYRGNRISLTSLTRLTGRLRKGL